MNHNEAYFTYTVCVIKHITKEYFFNSKLNTGY